MATHMIIRKRDGTDTIQMPQPQAALYLGNLPTLTANRTASLKQALSIDR